MRIPGEKDRGNKLKINVKLSKVPGGNPKYKLLGRGPWFNREMKSLEHKFKRSG